MSEIVVSFSFLLKHLSLHGQEAWNIALSLMVSTCLCLLSFCSNTGSIRDDPYWTSRKNSLELIELSSINKVSLV